MKEAFDRYDADNDGRISRPEYYAVIDKLGFKPFDRTRADHDFDGLDQNHDGYLTFSEFTGNVCKNGRYEH